MTSSSFQPVFPKKNTQGSKTKKSYNSIWVIQEIPFQWFDIINLYSEEREIAFLQD